MPRPRATAQDEIPRKRTRRPAPARQILFDTGREIFAELGYHGTTVDRICETAGLAKGAFYHHWSSKDDLLREIMDGIIQVEAELAEQALGWPGTATERMDRFIEELFVIIVRRRPEVKTFHAEVAMLERPDFAPVRDKAERFHAALRKILADGVASGEFRELESVEIVTWVISGALSYAYRWWPLNDSLTPEQAGRMISTFVLPGLKAESVATAGR
jgi:AcrR family transcriptional regulator